MAGSSGYPVPFIAQAVRSGMSASGALSAYREAGGAVRTQTWYRAWGQVQASVDDYTAELERPQSRRPIADELRQWQTKTATGYAQQAQVFMRDRETGEVVTRNFTLRGAGVVSRQSVIDTAISTFTDFSDQYGMQIVGGIYTGSYELVPEEE